MKDPAFLDPADHIPFGDPPAKGGQSFQPVRIPRADDRGVAPPGDSFHQPGPPRLLTEAPPPLRPPWTPPDLTPGPPIAPDPRPTLTRQQAMLLEMKAGADAAREAAKTDNDPQMVSALLCGAAGRPFECGGLSFHNTTAGMFFTDRLLDKLAPDGFDDEIEAILARAYIHHDPEGAWALLNGEQPLLTFLRQMRDAFFGLTLEQIQHITAWMSAEWARWSSPRKAGTPTPPAPMNPSASVEEALAAMAEAAPAGSSS